MCRPEIPIDWKKVDFLLEAGCEGVHVASHFGMHPETFYDRVVKEHKIAFSEYKAQKRSKGDSNIFAKQYEKALKGDNTLLLWLGKNRLNQKDRWDEDQIPNKKEINNLIDTVKAAYSSEEFKEKLREKIEEKKEENDDIH